MKHACRLPVFVLMAAALILVPATAQAGKFPENSITLFVPYAAGGATDIAIRPLAEAAKKYLGQPVIVENRPGAGGAVSVGAIVGKKPDGNCQFDRLIIEMPWMT